MLKHFSLHTINQIFSLECLVPISPKAKVAYMQCLTYHFMDMEPKVSNLVAFDLNKREVNQKSLPIFEELQTAGLVILSNTHITFINHWSKYIDKTDMEKIPAHEYLASVGYQEAGTYKEELLRAGKLHDVLKMEFKISPDQVMSYIEAFFAEQDATNKTYPSYHEAAKHCLRWIRIQIRENKQTKGVINKAFDARQSAHEIIKNRYNATNGNH